MAKRGDFGKLIRRSASLKSTATAILCSRWSSQEGAACHTGNYSCFFESLYGEGKYSGGYGIIDELYGVIEDRKANPKEGSYTNYLFEKGIDKILKKVGEESAEVIIAAKNASP